MRREGMGGGRLEWGVAWLVLGVLVGEADGRTLYVDSAEAFRGLEAGPGDEIVWRDGTYVDEGINLNATGSAEAGLVLRAETPGGVIFKGESFIRLGGDYITVSGFIFTNADDYFREVGSSVIQFRSNNGNRHAHHCRLTECAIIDMNSWERDVDDDDEDGDRDELIFHNSKWIQLYGTNHRVDHCYFAGKRVRGALLIAELVPEGGEDGSPYASYNHRIDHNYFGPIPVGWSGNEFETIRLGTSSHANFNGNMVVESNYFYRCDGEIEVISNKSSNNTYRNNLLLACRGSLVIRHGDNCTVDGNLILGMGEPETGGIRLNGAGHRIVNNYISGTRGTGLRSGLCLRAAGSIDTGDTGGGYEQVRNALIAFNTILDATESLNIGEAGNKDNKYPPRESILANNIVYSRLGQLVTWDKEPQAMTYAGNLVYGSPAGLTDAGIIVEDPLLENNGWGRLVPGPGSPALGAAVGAWQEGVARDMDGDIRPVDGADAGADQVGSGSEQALAPVTPVQVGPDWMRPAGFIEVAVMDLSITGQLEIRYRSEERLHRSLLGFEKSLDAVNWLPLPVLVDGPDMDGMYSAKVDSIADGTVWWRIRGK